MKRKPDRGALRQSGAITVGALATVREAAVAGVTTAALNTLAERYIRDHGGVPAFLGYRGFPAAICTSVNAQVVHGIPGEHELRDGDLLSVDMGVKYDGWYTDSALTVGIGALDQAARDLLRVTRESLEKGIAQAIPGKKTGDLGAAVQDYAEAAGLAVVRDCVGHGIGRKLHEEPSLPNYGTAGIGTTFTTGMVLAIEPMVVIGDPALELAADKWTLATRDRSLAAHFEETVLVTDGLPERLTPLEAALQGEKPGDKLGKAAREVSRPERSEGSFTA